MNELLHPGREIQDAAGRFTVLSTLGSAAWNVVLIGVVYALGATTGTG